MVPGSVRPKLVTVARSAAFRQEAGRAALPCLGSLVVVTGDASLKPPHRTVTTVQHFLGVQVHCSAGAPG